MKINLLRLLIVFSKYTLYGIVLQCMLFTVLIAASGNAQGIKSVHKVHLDINLENVSLFETFAHIEARTNFKFAYDRQDIKKRTKVSLKGKNLTVGELLLALSAQANLKFRQVNHYINVSKKDNLEKAIVNVIIQDNTITGKVTSGEDGQGLPGVNILVKGTNIGTVTDVEGNYTLNVPQNAETLVFSSIGFVTEEVDISNRTVVNITLSPDIQALAEVVVIGYGTQKKANVTGAIATMDAERLNERPIARLDQALVGQMAGVRVKQTTGLPGKPFSIQIRGTGSISAGNEPLYVIDGFPITTLGTDENGNFDNGSPLDNINPNDIASIEVLKDASASAIYGSRAANGVVLITTKKGTSRKPTFTFNAYVGTTQPAKKLDMLNSEEWIIRAKDMIDTQWERSGIPGANASQSTSERIEIYNDYQIANGNPTVDPDDYQTYNSSYMYDPRWDMEGHPGLDYIDWQDRMFRTGIFQNYQLSASGMTDVINYYISGNYNNNEGYIIGTEYQQFSVRANIDAKLSDRLKVGMNLAPSYSLRTDPGVEGKDNILHKMTSNTPVFEDDVNPEGDKYTTRYHWGSSGTDRLSRLEDWEANNTIFRTLITAYASYDILKNLTFRTTGNFDNNDGTFEYYRPNIDVSDIRGNYNTSRKQTFVNENTLTYNPKFGEHNLTLLLGHSYNRFQITNSSLSSGANYASSSVKTLPPNSTGSTNASRNILISYFGRAQYDYKGKYLLSASIRRDGSSKFGEDYRYGYFPSASAGWRISEENFMNELSAISNLKIRASYGLSGSDNIGAYSWSSNLSFYNYVFTGETGTATGQGVATSPNPDLHWEQSKSTNLGLDLGIFDNKIMGSFDYYTRTTSDLLLNVPAAAVSGFTTYLANVGKVRNNGWELELRSYNLTGNFSWNTSVNLSHNENEVLALGPDQERIEIGSGTGGNSWSILEVGLPMYSIYVIEQDGVITQEDLENYEPVGSEVFPTYNNATPFVGDPKYVDQNHDGVINADDRVVVGSPYPDFIWGITNQFSYKGFDLSVIVQGQNGGYIYSLLGRALNRTGMSLGENSIDVDPAERGNWKTSYGFVHNTDWLYKSDYISVRNITLGYDLGRHLNNVSKIAGARVYVTAENLIYWTAYKGGWNPEAANFSGSSDGDFPVPADYGGAPLSKSLVVGLNISFN